MNRLAAGIWLLIINMSASPLWAEEVLPYALTAPQGSGGSINGQSAYDNKARGSLDNEAMPQVSPRDSGPGLPAPYIVPYARGAQATEVLIGPAQRPAQSSGEDRVFEQIGAEPPSAYLEALEQLSD